MAHDHAHHSHSPGHDHDSAASSQSRVLTTFWLIAVFMVVEAVGGWWAGSLTLIADAGHMLTDSGALALAWFATRQTQRPSDAEKSYGHGRFSVLAALVNGLGLIAIIGWIAIEAVQRLISPTEVKALPMLAIAVTGFLVNAGAFFLLHGADRDNLNIRGAILHVVGDMLASVAAVVAATVILVMPGWTIADPILSVVASGLILRGAAGPGRQVLACADGGNAGRGERHRDCRGAGGAGGRDRYPPSPRLVAGARQDADHLACQARPRPYIRCSTRPDETDTCRTLSYRSFHNPD